VLGDDAVGEFVEEKGSKKENAGENAYAPLLSGGPAGILLFELHGEGIGDGGKNDDPCGMQKDGYPEDFADAHSWALRHIEWSLKASRLAIKRCKAGSRPNF